MTETTETCTCQDDSGTASCQPLTQVALAVTLTCPGDYSLTLNTEGDCTPVLTPCPEPPVNPEPPEPPVPPVPEPPVLNPDKPFDPALLAEGARLNDFTETVGQRLVVAGKLIHEGKGSGWLVRFSPDYSEVYQKILMQGITEIDHCVAVGNNLVATNHNRAVLLDANFSVMRGRALQGIDIRDIAATTDALYFAGTESRLSPSHPLLARLPQDLAETEVPAVKLVSDTSIMLDLLRALPNGDLVVRLWTDTLVLFSPDLTMKQAVQLPETVTCIEVDPQGQIYIGSQRYLLKLDSNLTLINGLKHELSYAHGLSWQDGQLYAHYGTTSRGEQPAGNDDLVQLQVDCASMTLKAVQLIARIDDTSFLEDIKASGHLSNGDRVVVGYRGYVPWGLVNDQPLLSDASAWQHSELDPLDFHTFPASPELTPVELTFEATTVTLSDYDMLTREPVLTNSDSTLEVSYR